MELLVEMLDMLQELRVFVVGNIYLVYQLFDSFLCYRLVNYGRDKLTIFGCGFH